MATNTFVMQDWTDILQEAELSKLVALDPGGQSGLVVRLLGLFADSLGSQSAQMMVARSSRDATTARRNAHTIKSGANNMGALDVGALAAKCEQICRTDEQWPTSPSIDDFLALCRSREQAIRERLR